MEALPFIVPFASLVVETLLYGIYFIMAISTFWVLIQRSRTSESGRISPVILCCSAILFVSLTIHWALSISITYRGFVVNGTNPLMSLAVLYDPSAVISVMRLATYALAAVTIDVTLVYRLWIVWGRSWRIAAVPSLAVLFNTVGCIIIIVLSATSTDHVFSAKLKYWTSVVYSVQAATNVICSGLIAIRIIRNSMVSTSHMSRGTLMPVVWIIIESAALYTAFTICTMALVLSGSLMVMFCVDIIPPIIGISSSLLVVRIAFAAAGSSRNPSSQMPSGTLFISSHTTQECSRSPHDDVPLKVSVTRHALATRDEEADAKHDLEFSRASVVSSPVFSKRPE